VGRRQGRPADRAGDRRRPACPVRGPGLGPFDLAAPVPLG